MVVGTIADDGLQVWGAANLTAYDRLDFGLGPGVIPVRVSFPPDRAPIG